MYLYKPVWIVQRKKEQMKLMQESLQLFNLELDSSQMFNISFFSFEQSYSKENTQKTKH